MAYTVDCNSTKRLGWVKTFSSTKGYGFIIDLTTGQDVFVHHQDILRCIPGFRAVWRGEYVSFSPETTERGTVARQVTGVCGGPLFCEVTADATPAFVPLLRPAVAAAAAPDPEAESEAAFEDAEEAQPASGEEQPAPLG
jgi:cold shock CspA family protein